MPYRFGALVAFLIAAQAGMAADAASAAPLETSLPAIAGNDNTVPAGRLTGGVLRLSLVAERGRFFPDGPGPIGLPAEAFAEEGKAPSIPGPLVRVPLGTRVEVRVRNALGHELYVRGLGPPASGLDSVLRIARGAVRTTRFVLDRAGAFGYYGADRDTTLDNRIGHEDSELDGVILVERPGTPRVDHVFVLELYDRVLTARGQPNFLYLLETINGRSFPATEHLTYARGRRVRWAVFNASAMTHPMHLHGFYFRLDGTDAYDEVTHAFHPGDAGILTWTADRAGSWMYHCHIDDHVSQHAPLREMAQPPASTRSIDKVKVAARFHLPNRPMGGMVIGVTVTAPQGSAPPPVAAHPRRLALAIHAERPSVEPYPDLWKATLTLGDGTAVTRSQGDLGPPIVLERGAPVAIAVTNGTPEETSLHWHGIALADSYYDGGGGMGMPMPGSQARMSPPIAPGATFVARFTPPDAGTFIYHAHMDDGWQLGAGIDGPLVVLPPGARTDDPTDHVVMIGESYARSGSPFVAINGSLEPAPIVMQAGVPQRLRIICLTLGGENLVASLVDGTHPQTWRPIAKDGHDLPARLQRDQIATQAFTIGETRDFRFVPAHPGALTLDIYDNDDNGQRVGTLPLTVIAP